MLTLTLHLALALVPVLPAQPAGTPPTAPPASASQPAGPAPAPSGNPQDVIRDLERRANQPPSAPAAPSVPAPTDAPTPAGAPGVAPAGSPVSPGGPGIAVQASGRLLREGTFLASRRGRMVRTSDGQWAYAFDADRSGKAEPAMTLMPCLNLQAMEKLAERGGDSLSFTVSGQVFVYRGRNYFLPTLYAVNRRAEVSGRG